MCFNSVTHGCTNEFTGLWLKVMSSRDQILDSAGDSGSSFHFILKAQYTCFEIPVFTPKILYLFTPSRISNLLHRPTFLHQQNLHRDIFNQIKTSVKVLILSTQDVLSCFGNLTRFINQVKKRKILGKPYTQRGNCFGIKI